MLDSLRRLDPGQSLPAILFYKCIRACSFAAFRLVYRARVRHREHIPGAGGLLIVANHQSHLDPPFVGGAFRTRHMVFIARGGLFSNRFFGWFIKSINALPINETLPDSTAIRTAAGALKKGRAVLIFPEGSRSRDGQLGEFKRGAWVLLKAGRCTVLPVGIAGCFEAWPRSRTLPRLFGQRVAMAIGEPIPFETFAPLESEAGLELIRSRIADLRDEAQASITTRRAASTQPPAAAR